MAKTVSIPLVVIVGETASGKSKLALQIAKKYHGEIICADAWTIRRGVDIGTAKPSREDRASIPHHLIDIIGPTDTFSAYDFKILANQAIQDIHRRDKLPIMVGGSGLYIDGLLYDYSFLEVADKSKRQKLNDLSLKELNQVLLDQNVDVSAEDSTNRHRLIRQIETVGRQSTKNGLRSNSLILGIKLDKDVLKQRITNRVDSMINDGLEEEVSKLIKRYDWSVPALKGIGYNEWQSYFLDQISLDEVKALIIKDSLNLAKRQRTWFKRNKSIHWLDTPVKWSYVVDLMTTEIER